MTARESKCEEVFRTVAAVWVYVEAVVFSLALGVRNELVHFVAELTWKPEALKSLYGVDEVKDGESIVLLQGQHV